MGRSQRSDAAPDRPATTCVVFTIPESRLRAMDVATGPCVPLSGRKRALKSPLAQEGPEHPEQMAALWTMLTGRPADGALVLVEERDGSRLFRCSDEFVRVMSEANGALVRAGDEDDAAVDEALTRFTALQDDLAHRWLREGGWHSEMVATHNRLHRLATASQAFEKGQPLYCWYGPPVPQYVIASGTPEELPAYLAEKRRSR